MRIIGLGKRLLGVRAVVGVGATAAAVVVVVVVVAEGGIGA